MTIIISGTSGVTYPAGGVDNVAGSGVGTTDTQTLTNKTLTSPTINTATLVTPTIDSASVPTVSGTAPLYMARAWVNFNGVPTLAIRASGNVTSVTRNGTGDYTVNFTTAMPDANYVTVCTGVVVNDQGSTYGFGTRVLTSAGASATLKSTTQYRVLCRQSSDFDLAEANVAIFR